MSGDLEDFLKRAAQRRQTQAPQPQQPSSGSARPPRPEYTDSRSERLPQAGRFAEDIDEVMTAEVVPDRLDYLAEKQQEIEAAKKKATEAEAEAEKKTAEARKGGRQPETSPGDLPLSDNPAEDLRRMLKQPGGLRQAVLMKEIMDRPEHRW